MFSEFLMLLSLSGLVFATVGGEEYLPTCKSIERVISNASKVYYPGDPLYGKGIYHWASSSTENPACVVEPGTPLDVGEILKVIDATKTPFAVKSGGHTANPGFSSTKGVHIYTGKFSQVTYDKSSGTVVIGSGLIWDTVYERLQEHRVSVVGGRVTGVGVGGLLLGGGYSYKTNQYGLAIDNIVGYDLVLPNGTVTYVTQSTQPDLFFGLKGGFNNFGIVTDFTVKAFPQTKVWGGQVTYSYLDFEAVRSAIANFSANVKDPKAAILPSYVSAVGIQMISQGFFYDGPTPPPGIFDEFTKILPISSDLKTRSYLDMVLSSDSNATAGSRTSFNSLGVSHYTQTFLEAIEEELTYWTAKLLLKGATLSYTAEPFLQSYLSHATSPSAFPPPAARQSGKAPNPLFLSFSWESPLFDDDFHAAIEETIRRLSAVARQEGLLIDDPPVVYGNYVVADTPLVNIYGDNLPKLKALKAEIDPTNVMGLTGGFKF